MVWKFLQRSKGSAVLATKQALLRIVLFQYIPRFARFVPLNAQLKKTAGVFAESALVGAAYYLLWYLLSSHVSCLRHVVYKIAVCCYFSFTCLGETILIYDMEADNFV